MVDVLLENPKIPALSIRQPWAWAILAGWKDVENRSRPFQYHGPLFIHASTKHDPTADTFLLDQGITPPPDLPTQALIGLVYMTGVTRQATSRFAQADLWHYLFTAPHSLAPIPFKGQSHVFYPDLCQIESRLRETVAQYIQSLPSIAPARESDFSGRTSDET